MTISNGYCTLAEARGRLSITDAADTTDDTKIEAIIEAASRLIDNYCGRRFFVDSADATRYFSPEFADILDPGDLVSVTTLTVDEDGDRTYERTWSTTDYDLLPFNAAADGRPYSAIAITPRGLYSFPVGVSKSVKIAGKWGWPSVPDAVNEACLLQTERLFKRKDAIFGIAGPSELGQMITIANIDPDVKMLLRGYRNLRIGAI